MMRRSLVYLSALSLLSVLTSFDTSPSRADHVIDGCSVPKNLDNASKWKKMALLPAYHYKGVFREACNNHDRCYATPGAVKPQCERNFLRDMSRACKIRDGGPLLPCLAVRDAYFYAVDIKGKFEKVQKHSILTKRSDDIDCQKYLVRGDVSKARGKRNRRTCALNSYEGYYWGKDNHKSGICPAGSYAYGFQQRVERSQGRRDDTALNGIYINCRNIGGQRRGGVVSVDSKSKWGRLGSWTYCPTGMWITGYRLKVEKYQDSWTASKLGKFFKGNWRDKDDTGTNAIEFRCRNQDWTKKVDISVNNNGSWGSWGSWVEAQPGLFVVGIHAHIERPQGRGDDTAMNQVWFSVARQPSL